MLQNELKSKLREKKSIRVGRGDSSGRGRTCGRGDKGQNSRKSGGVKAWFEGGQTPLYRRLPKLKGFKNRSKLQYQIVNVQDLERFDGQDVRIETLYKFGLLSKVNLPYKVLGYGDIKAKIKLFVNKISQTAKKKIEKAGGTVELIK